MTIHSSHPFADPESERDAARRLRGRLGGTVSLWTTGTGPDRAGLTVSSLMIANGEPAHALALVDPDSDFAAGVQETGAAVVQLLEWPHRDLAEAFAGLAPAPGGVFRLGSWTDTDWGPRLDGASAWAGVRVAAEPTEVGWSLLLDAAIEHVEIGEEAQPLVHRRGRYVRPG
jgi:flavin reductase (DIM6/NTAB) family NADH-FMN oxidoreductase RutF